MRPCRIRYAVVLLLALCAAAPMPAVAAADDPLEPVNRAVFVFNRELDRFVLRPTTVAYRSVAPRALRQGISQFLNNLVEPVHALNAVLQGDADGVETALSRFLLNTIMGLGGFLDIATEAGVYRDPKGFGSTLAHWGVEPGPYLVLPALGPSTVRELTGFGFDTVSTPHRYLVRTSGASATLTAAETGLRAVQFRDEYFEEIDAGLTTSLDAYASARSAYLQRLRARGQPDSGPVRELDFNFDDE